MAGQDSPDLSPSSAAGAGGPDPLIGELVAGRYRVLEHLAQGGMGKIYKAEQQPLGRMVVLKVLHERQAGAFGEEFRARFLLEAATLARLQHPNTVTVFDYGVHGPEELLFMVMEFVDGRTLSQLSRDEGVLPPGRALRLTYEIARALEEAHSLGVVHRDLKPGNVMILPMTGGELVKVLDFGIAKVLDEAEDDQLTRADQLIGSPRYMAPEQIQNTQVGPSTDHYSLGVILYELLSGISPFRRDTQLATLFAHLQDEPKRLAEVAPQVIPARLEALVHRMLLKQTVGRFPNTRALREEMLSVLDEVDGPSTLSQRVSRPGLHSLPEPDSQHTMSQRSLRDTVTAPMSARGLTDEAEEPEGPGRILALVVVLGLLAGLLGAGGAWWALGQRGAPVEGPAVPALEAPGLEPAASDAPAATPAEVGLELRSDPGGAEVFEGEQRLGTTPLTLPLSSDPSAAARRFTLRLAGHLDAERVVEPSAEALTLDVSLSPTPSPKASPKRSQPPSPPADEGLRGRR